MEQQAQGGVARTELNDIVAAGQGDRVCRLFVSLPGDGAVR